MKKPILGMAIILASACAVGAQQASVTPSTERGTDNVAAPFSDTSAAQINLGYTNIVSPVSGTVVARNVTMGQTVEQGEQIGAIGATGEATGPHLHFEVRVNNKPTDPVPWLPPRS